MFRSPRIRSTFLAGVLVISILAGTGCGKSKETKETSCSQSESSDTIATTSVSDSGSSETQGSSSTSQETSDPSSDESFTDEDFKEDALKLAKELGVKEEELHGKYGLFIQYVDCINLNTQLGTLKDYVLHLFPVVADHLEPGDENYFFQNLSELRAEIGEAISPSFGEFHPDDNLIIINDKGDTSESSAGYNIMYRLLLVHPVLPQALDFRSLQKKELQTQV